ncbi:hypothetical protein GGR60_000922 [Xanthomonas arboricola]|uniref:hypothetical protein n=1 Tax=Xanthomonas euroxanthea TaxID=2259622 RepID=UPI001431F5E5|nr:hypothetical protein [Xanthomonas euroxanthea]NJC36432.1 hypothetical protein [Xanthomonas euroxanthea]
MHEDLIGRLTFALEKQKAGAFSYLFSEAIAALSAQPDAGSGGDARAQVADGMLPPLPIAFFDEFGRGADDRVQDYARAAILATHPQPAAAIADINATRYLYLRSQPVEGGPWGTPRIAIPSSERAGQFANGEDADAAIDAAIAAAVPKCLTCGGRGWVGGPTGQDPGESGEQCPDCDALENWNRAQWAGEVQP